MHNAFTPETEAPAAEAGTAEGRMTTPTSAPRRTRIGIAGATGFTGQELLRLLPRHPGVVVSLATSSSSNSAARKMPALSKIWDGELTPLSVDALLRDTDLVFLALPDTAAAELAPRVVESGRKVIDLSG